MGDSLPVHFFQVLDAFGRAAGDQLADKSGHGAAGQPGHIILVSGLLLQALLDHHQRLFLQPGPAVLRNGNGRRPHPIFSRLPFRRQQTRYRLDTNDPPERRRQDKDFKRQRGEVVEVVIVGWIAA